MTVSVQQPKPRKQHYLPRLAYLKHFENPIKPGQIYLYRRGNAAPVPTSTEKVGCERDLYTVTDEQGAPDFRVETQIFGALDGGLTPLLKILNEPLPPILTSSERIIYYGQFVDLCTFAGFQLMRTPAMLQQLQASSLEMMKQVMRRAAAYKAEFNASTRRMLQVRGESDEWTDEQIEATRQFTLEGNYNLSVDKNDWYLGVALDVTNQIVPSVMMKELIVWKSPPGKQFITSDYPVTKIPDKNMPPQFRGGALGSHIYLPIGSRTALFFFNGDKPRGPKHYNCIERIQYKEITGHQVDELNQLMVKGAEDQVLAGFSDQSILNDLNGQRKPVRFQVG